MFSKDFAWGVADSAYQIEGRAPGDGCGKTVWDTFCEAGGYMRGRTPGRPATISTATGRILP